ncbi:unnamed protein product, partial [Linum tenue]
NKYPPVLRLQIRKEFARRSVERRILSQEKLGFIIVGVSCAVERAIYHDLRRQLSSVPFFPQPEGWHFGQEENGGAEAQGTEVQSK